jgi:hypothetical protein
MEMQQQLSEHTRDDSTNVFTLQKYEFPKPMTPSSNRERILTISSSVTLLNSGRWVGS